MRYLFADYTYQISRLVSESGQIRASDLREMIFGSQDRLVSDVSNDVIHDVIDDVLDDVLDDVMHDVIVEDCVRILCESWAIWAIVT